MKRNRKRFPSEFMFRLNRREKDEVITNCDHLRKLKFSPNLPFAFTEYGAVMAANVLNSSIAVQASVAVVRAFIRFREVLGSQRQLAVKLLELEKRVGEHDDEISAPFEAIRQMMQPPENPKRQIGFHSHAR